MSVTTWAMAASGTCERTQDHEKAGAAGLLHNGPQNFGIFLPPLPFATTRAREEDPHVTLSSR